MRGLGDEGLEDGEDAALLAAGESGDGGEETLGLAAWLGWLAAWPARSVRRAEKHLDGDAEGLRHGREDVTPRGLRASFPEGDVGLRDAQQPGQLRLSEARCLTQLREVEAQGRTGGGLSRLTRHGRSVGPGFHGA